MLSQEGDHVFLFFMATADIFFLVNEGHGRSSRDPSKKMHATDQCRYTLYFTGWTFLQELLSRCASTFVTGARKQQNQTTVDEESVWRLEPDRGDMNSIWVNLKLEFKSNSWIKLKLRFQTIWTVLKQWLKWKLWLIFTTSLLVYFISSYKYYFTIQITSLIMFKKVDLPNLARGITIYFISPYKYEI